MLDADGRPAAVRLLEDHQVRHTGRPEFDENMALLEGRPRQRAAQLEIQPIRPSTAVTGSAAFAHHGEQRFALVGLDIGRGFRPRQRRLDRTQ